MQRLKFYSIGDWGGQDSMSYLLRLHQMSEVRNPDLADIIVFNGGADIGTEIYGEAPAFRGIPAFRSRRDDEEIDIFNTYVGDKFFLGICRGAQLLNCLNGGTLWQHVDNHGKYHKMLDLRTGKNIFISSTHHQMMRPNLNKGTVIAVASESKNKFSEKDTLNDIHDTNHDIETVWYPESRSLCIQGHPEYMPGSEFADWSVELLLGCYKAAA
jgi:putative glutamine amidotransferase